MCVIGLPLISCSFTEGRYGKFSGKRKKSWGIKLLSGSYYYSSKSNSPKDYPEWVERRITSYSRLSGAVIWDNEAKKADIFSAAECLTILERLTSTTDWKESGVSLTKQVYRIAITIERKKKKRGKSIEQVAEEEPKQEKQSAEPIDEEVVHLPAEAGKELISLFETNKTLLIKDAEAEEKRCKEALFRAYDLLFDWMRKDEEQKIGFPTRKFPWTEVSNKPHKWLCDLKKDRAVVSLDPPFYWHAHIQHQGAYWKSRYDFKNLEEAVNWVEEELTTLEQMPVEEEKPVTKEERKVIRQRVREKMAQSPYLIKPSDLEPANITYRIVIDVETSPIDFKSFDTPYGETVKYGEKYLSPLKLSNQLRLDPDQFEITQPLGENSDWCKFSSLVTFFQDALAISQAQNLWNQSLIVHQFKAKQIVRARYGYEETETGYTVYLGGCFDPEHPWVFNETRQEYLENHALHLSVYNTLDVPLLREYLALSEELISDEKLLFMMHEARAESKFIPSAEQKASQIWLIEQKHKEPGTDKGRKR